MSIYSYYWVRLAGYGEWYLAIEVTKHPPRFWFPCYHEVRGIRNACESVEDYRKRYPGDTIVGPLEEPEVEGNEADEENEDYAVNDVQVSNDGSADVPFSSTSTNPWHELKSKVDAKHCSVGVQPSKPWPRPKRKVDAEYYWVRRAGSSDWGLALDKGDFWFAGPRRWTGDRETCVSFDEYRQRFPEDEVIGPLESPNPTKLLLSRLTFCEAKLSAQGKEIAALQRMARQLSDQMDQVEGGLSDGGLSKSALKEGVSKGGVNWEYSIKRRPGPPKPNKSPKLPTP